LAESNQLFCAKPFKWFEVSRGKVEGEVFLCCPTWLDTPVGNLDTQSGEEIWNSDIAQDIRRSILDGSFEYCNRVRCPFLHTVTGPVQPLNEVIDPDLVEVIEHGLTKLPYGPREINCSYDRSCNLSCPTCRPHIIMETKNKGRILNIQRKINDELLYDAHLLYITGSGDPFGSPYFRKWLQTMKRSDMPKLNLIRLHTNAMLWNPRMWDTIPPEIQSLVKQVDISIDAATPTTYVINRRGGDFDVLLKNLAFISSLRKNGPIEWLGISMVVQENNFNEMADFINLGKRLNVDTVYFQQLTNWGTFSDKEFAARAVHLPTHPKHRQAVALLQNNIFDDPLVHLGNLSPLRNGSSVAAPPKTKNLLHLLFGA
jgi:MoaA/NifB/PqqE/SkfB family radical SAM enzyme